MDSLVGKHTVAAVRKALQNLPREVDDTYDDALQRSSNSREIKHYRTYGCSLSLFRNQDQFSAYTASCVQLGRLVQSILRKDIDGSWIRLFDNIRLLQTPNTDNEQVVGC